MGNVLSDAEFAHFFDEIARFDFQLSRQLIDSDLARIQKYRYLPAVCVILTTSDSTPLTKSFSG